MLLLLEFGAVPDPNLYFTGDLNIIKLLLDHWPSNEPIEYVRILKIAISQRYPDNVKYLLERADGPINYHLLLPDALSSNNITIIREILSYGINPIYLPDEEDEDEENAIRSTLLYAVSENCSTDVIKLLLDFHDLQIPLHDKLIESACVTALHSGFMAIAKLLLTQLPHTSHAKFLCTFINKIAY